MQKVVYGFVVVFLLVENPKVINKVIPKLSTEIKLFWSCFNHLIVLYLSYGCLVKPKVIHRNGYPLLLLSYVEIDRRF